MNQELKFRRMQNRLIVIFLKIIPKKFHDDFIFWYAEKQAMNVREIYDKIESYETIKCVKSADFMRKKHNIDA